MHLRKVEDKLWAQLGRPLRNSHVTDRKDVVGAFCISSAMSYLFDLSQNKTGF